MLAITEEVRALEHLDLDGLRHAWRRRYGAPPKLRSVDLLARLLAWRIQAEAFGGLDAETRRNLRRASASPRDRQLSAGSLIVREWQGRRHEVTVGECAYQYEGQTYQSLSAVAQAITGVKWNGPRFFGLRAGSPT
uniref:DUF2924 domain-containing protein n=1 Tax=Phenylobacterium glaciei TaxID=2803784 RepID=A0A974P6J8_9CAUL|nr:DUF2924 domain-containing protein [Phenylobacterium glaciei]